MWDESQIGCEMTPELNDSLVIEYFLFGTIYKISV